METERPDVAPTVVRSDWDPAAATPALAHLGAAGSLLIAGLVMLAFGAGWAYYFYPPESLAAAGAITCAAFAVAAFGAALHAFLETGRWVRRRV
jgi:hypothetical protein